VDLHGGLRDLELTGDLLVGQTFLQSFEDIQLRIPTIAAIDSD